MLETFPVPGRALLMKATIKDVAREAGVAVSTVSRAFNESGPVGEETRRRVMEAAQKLRYVPNDAARSLITNKTNTLGVLLPDLHGEFFSEVIRGIDQTARQHDFHLLVSSSHEDRSEIEAALRAMQGRVDGLVVMSPDLDGETLVDNLPRSQPVVLMNCHVDGDAFDMLDITNYEGAREVAEYLLELGHRDIGLIRGLDGNHDADERRRGYRETLQDAGYWNADLEVPGHFSEKTGFEAARELLTRSPRPTALFAANDVMAIGALHAIAEAGLSVPDDVSVVGFDDIPIARYVSPPLTSVHVPISDLGVRAVEMLLHAIGVENAHTRQRVTLPVRLVVRESSGPPPGSRT